MILFDFEQLGLQQYLNALIPYQLPGSTSTSKLLGAPFRSGKVSIMYTEPGLTVLRSTLHLGNEIMLLKGTHSKPPVLPEDTYYNLGFTTLSAPSGPPILHSQGMVERISEKQEFMTYSSNMTPTLIIYPVYYHTDSLFVQASEKWLRLNVPHLSPLYASPVSRNSIRSVHVTPTSFLRKLISNRNNWDIDNKENDSNKRILLMQFIEYYYNITCSANAVESTVENSMAVHCRLMDKLIEQILLNIHKPLPSIQVMSHSVGLNANTLRAAFKKVYGKSLMDFFREEQMAWAERQMQQNGHSVKSVGYTLGYHNLSHFARIYKKYRGHLPGSSKEIYSLKK